MTSSKSFLSASIHMVRMVWTNADPLTERRAQLLALFLLFIASSGQCVNSEGEVDPSDTNSLARAGITAITWRGLPNANATTSHLFRVTLDLAHVRSGREISLRLVTTPTESYRPFHLNEINARVRNLGSWYVASNREDQVNVSFAVAAADLPTTCLKLKEKHQTSLLRSPFKGGSTLIIDLQRAVNASKAADNHGSIGVCPEWR